MKIITSYIPANENDTSITITATSEDSVFNVSNLKSLEPVKCWKSTDTSTEQKIKFDFGSVAKHANTLFLNRINFAECTILYSTDDVTYNILETITGMETDEIADENYIKRWIELGDITFRYVKIAIPSQTPLFETSYFKIGNALFGNYTEIWDPKNGFSVEIMPKMSITEFGSGYISSVKRGRTRRQFTGNFENITMEEYNKLSLTYNPLIIYNDFENDFSKCYLVRHVKSFKRTYKMSNIVTHSFVYEEIV